MTRRVEVTGGTRGEGGEFIPIKSTVVEEKDLAILFRRDWKLCGMPVVRIRNLF